MLFPSTIICLKRQVGRLFVDLEKGFDMGDHMVAPIWYPSKNFLRGGVKGTAHKLLENFTCKVPQGTVLGVFESEPEFISEFIYLFFL